MIKEKIDAMIQESLRNSIIAAIVVIVGIAGTWFAIDRKDSKPDKPKVEDVRPASGTVKLLSVTKGDKEFYINFKYTDNSHWPVKVYPDGSKINAWIMINGQRVEQFRPGYQSQHLKNVYGGAPYGIKGIKTGDKVQIQIQSRDGKETSNKVEFVWPWKNT